MICFTKVALAYGWLGNMSPHPIRTKVAIYPTAEHYFQLKRLRPDHPCRERVLATKSPMAAKLLVKTYLPEDAVVVLLSIADVDNMRMTLKHKFDQHKDLRAKLLATGDEVLVEDVTARQHKGSAMWWGAVPVLPGLKHYIGHNTLGKLLMELREDIRLKSIGL